MDDSFLLNALLVVLFVLIGGVFAGTEMAIVSLRESQVRRIEGRGGRGPTTAALVRNPNRFLSAVQIGVTLAGFFSSAYGAATLAPDIEPILMGWGIPDGIADTTALIGMTLVIAYLSLVFGELVPKRLAMQRAEGFTTVLAPPLNVFATLMRPVIWLLSVSTNAMVRLLGGDPRITTEEVSAEELHQMVRDNRSLHSDHRRILTDVFDANDRLIREVMRPRTDVEFLRARTSIAEARERVSEQPYTRYPIYRDSIDDVVGFVHIRDLLELEGDNGGTLENLVRPILPVPGTNKLLPTLGTMRREAQHIALVVDEYGGTDGIVTLEDLVEELVGEIEDEYDVGEHFGQSDDAALDPGESSVVDARLIIQEVPRIIGAELPDDGHYETLAGFFIARLGRIPVPGDSVIAAGHRFEALTVEKNRLDRLLITRLPLDGYSPVDPG